MKLVVLAGGLGSRISEETETKPKPMIEIGGRPILWHILKIYSCFGINEFVICCGYKGYVIKEYFANYFLHMSDVTFDLATNEMQVHKRHVEPWKITLVDTGRESMTGGRIKRVQPYLDEDQPFCLTYGDCVANVDIGALIQFHKHQQSRCTLTAVQPPGRFGALVLDAEDRVTQFQEKPLGDGGYINGGFFVCEPSVLNLIQDDATVWEQGPLTTLSEKGEISAYRHEGFWHPMDTLRDKRYLDELWVKGTAPWKTW